MTGKRSLFFVSVVTAVVLCSTAAANAQRGAGRGGCGGCAQGRGGCGGCDKGCGGGRHGQDAAFEQDREIFHFLLTHRDHIERQVTNLEDGVETVTETADPVVRAKLRDHVTAMARRIDRRRPIHRRDPLFAALFDHAGEVKMTIEKTPRGVKVRETSDNPYVARLIQAHARVVSLFVKNGFDEVHKNHPLPPAVPEVTVPPCWLSALDLH